MNFFFHRRAAKLVLRTLLQLDASLATKIFYELGGGVSVPSSFPCSLLADSQTEMDGWEMGPRNFYQEREVPVRAYVVRT